MYTSYLRIFQTYWQVLGIYLATQKEFKVRVFMRMFIAAIFTILSFVFSPTLPNFPKFRTAFYLSLAFGIAKAAAMEQTLMIRNNQLLLQMATLIYPNVLALMIELFAYTFQYTEADLVDQVVPEGELPKTAIKSNWPTLLGWTISDVVVIIHFAFLASGKTVLGIKNKMQRSKFGGVFQVLIPTVKDILKSWKLIVFFLMMTPFYVSACATFGAMHSKFTDTAALDGSEIDFTN